ncbi:MAG: nitronate monooxygenase, partial [Janthinobacterium lividum]
HRAALMNARDNQTALTNLFTGRPARGLVNRLMRELGPMQDAAPQFPLAGGALAALKNATQELAPADFIPMWSGQAARLGRTMPAAELTRLLAQEAQILLARLGGQGQETAGNT